MEPREPKNKNSKIRYLVTKLNPKSYISEQYRTVRTNIQFASVGENIQAIVVTSASPGEGKSMTVVNLAVVCAQQAKKILIIDSDLRKPTVHYTFNLNNEKGLSNILVNHSTLNEAVKPSGVENLDVITSGPIPPNPSELLGSKNMHHLLEDARQIYDVILFDTPPVLAVTDAQILAHLTDASILVVRGKRTKIEAAQKAIDALKTVDSKKLLGTILNDIDKKEEYNYH